MYDIDTIVRVEDSIRFGLVCRSLFGLNILAANHVSSSAGIDPRLALLELFTRNNICSAHTGSMALMDIAASPINFFRLGMNQSNYLPTSVELYNATFGDLTGWNYPPACFFPLVREGFWKPKLSSGYDSLEYLIRCAALALYIVPAEGGLEAMNKLINSPFLGHEEWIREVASIYSAIVLTGHDGQYFHVFTSNVAHLELLHLPLDATIKSIKNLDWYQQNNSTLYWSEQELCLKPYSK